MGGGVGGWDIDLPCDGYGTKMLVLRSVVSEH